MFLEIIALSAQDVIDAAAAGADRVELVSDMAADGLSPTIETLRDVATVATIPVMVMVRFHNRDFIYNQDELEQMAAFMDEARNYNIGGFVFGTLNTERQVDTYSLEYLLAHAGNLPVTFHRAFDRVRDQTEALEVLLRYPQVKTILTSGGTQPIAENIAHLQQLERQASGQIRILAGGGITADNLPALKNTGVKSMHIGSLARYFGDFFEAIDIDYVQSLKK